MAQIELHYEPTSAATRGQFRSYLWVGPKRFDRTTWFGLKSPAEMLSLMWIAPGTEADRDNLLLDGQVMYCTDTQDVWCRIGDKVLRVSVTP